MSEIQTIVDFRHLTTVGYLESSVLRHISFQNVSKIWNFGLDFRHFYAVSDIRTCLFGFQTSRFQTLTYFTVFKFSGSGILALYASNAAAKLGVQSHIFACEVSPGNFLVFKPSYFCCNIYFSYCLFTLIRLTHE